ncbi:hypothetical protein DL93DRAFT_2088548 [Clavulina sp. PMI_390]|nr:hypothetical protein DL93DRAFT_2088548 [Clavulina sp. PMI_390]
MRPKILLSGVLRWAHADLERLIAPHADIVQLTSASREEFKQDLKGKLSGVVGIYRRNESSRQIGTYDAELIAMLPESVKWIAHNGAGYDQVDVHACKARGILVTNTPGAVDDGTATTALYLIISACRQFALGERNARAGLWKKDFQPAHDPSSRTLGILGLGGIGLRTAEMARGIPMKVVYHNRKPAPNAPAWAEYCSTMEEFLSKTDVLSIHVPLTSATINMVGEKEIRMLKKGSIIVNTARGKVLDEQALIRALKDGHLFGAGLDVFANEPEINPELISLPNVAMLPHLGTSTEESQHAMEVRALENLSEFLQGREGKDIVPETR